MSNIMIRIIESEGKGSTEGSRLLYGFAEDGRRFIEEPVWLLGLQLRLSGDCFLFWSCCHGPRTQDMRNIGNESCTTVKLELSFDVSAGVPLANCCCRGCWWLFLYGRCSWRLLISTRNLWFRSTSSTQYSFCNTGLHKFFPEPNTELLYNSPGNGYGGEATGLSDGDGFDISVSFAV